MSTLPAFAEVAFPLPLRHTFTYRIPERLAARATPGAQVVAPFRGRSRRGFVVGTAERTTLQEVRELAAVLEDAALSPHLLELARWVAEYYIAPLGQVLSTALPGGLGGFAGSRGRRAAREDPVIPLGMPERMTLTAAQREAVQAVQQAIGEAAFAALLLHGVTASGKTEVYLRAARAAREAGGQALILVPEIALGSQVIEHFRRRFGARVGVLHSRLAIGERRRQWELARRGGVDVVVGARSAVFAPLPRLSLIVVDEEHEPAYKQSEQLRYHGRDTAVRRAQMLGIPVVLGSATPSIESLANAARGKYRTLELRHRVDRRPLPRARIVDLRHEKAPGDTISRELRDAIRDRLARREQALLFLNRRGQFHYTQCRACGFVPECPDCDIALTLHGAPHAWCCHYCGHAEPFRTRCPQCGGAVLRFSGAGTQRVERELQQVSPECRVLRLDTDVARAPGASAGVLRRFARGEADVLVGTQMIAKGLDFPRVTLVGVLDADIALHLPDFRAAERTYQLLVQVAGRAGRGEQAGEVLVQTCSPDHPAIVAAVRGDAAAFLAYELEHRREAGYPPFSRLLALLVSGRDEAEVERAAGRLAAAVREDESARDIEVLGPAPQTLARLRGQHRWHVLLKGARSPDLRRAAERALAADEGRAGRPQVKRIADVDPIEVL
jgi:primosomal protein N' (replication factor Y)